MYRKGYGIGKIILNFPPFCQLNQEYEEWENKFKVMRDFFQKLSPPNMKFIFFLLQNMFWLAQINNLKQKCCCWNYTSKQASICQEHVSKCGTWIVAATLLLIVENCSLHSEVLSIYPHKGDDWPKKASIQKEKTMTWNPTI